MTAATLPIPLRDEDVLRFVGIHGRAKAGRLLGMSRHGLGALLRAIARRSLGGTLSPPAGSDARAALTAAEAEWLRQTLAEHREAADRGKAELMQAFAATQTAPRAEPEDELPAWLDRLLKDSPALQDGEPRPLAPQEAQPNAAAPEPKVDTAGGFRPGDVVEVVRPGPTLGRRGRVERLKPEGVVVRLDGVANLVLCKPEHVRPVRKTKGGEPCAEVRRLLDVVLHGKPRAAIRAFRTLTALGEFHMPQVRRMIELANVGRPTITAAAAQALRAAHKAKRRMAGMQG